MQQEPTFTGIDISKLTLDICVSRGSKKEYHVINNEPEAIRSFFTPLLPLKAKGLHIGMENTGAYNYNLYQVLSELDIVYYVIPPIHLKKSLGLSRGKTDKIDAARIAYFLETNLKSMSLYIPQRPVLRELQVLLANRRQRVKLKKQVAAAKELYQHIEDDNLVTLDNELIVHIDQQIKVIEKKIDNLIAADSSLNKAYQLITSVQGVGKILACNLLVKTGEFSGISCPRKLACYAGVAPFSHQSGTSIRGRSRISHYADKDLKMLLHLASMSVIRLSGDMRDYYQRKVAEGKNKMSVLNAVRNKMIHRIYAVLKNQRPYQIYLPGDLVVS